VARSDYFTDVVQPYGTIVNDGNLTDVSYKILKLARQFSASEAIIGVPLDSDGVMSRNVRNINGQLCLNFSNVFSSIAAHSYNSSFRTVLFDERYSTREARWRIQTDKIKGDYCMLTYILFRCWISACMSCNTSPLTIFPASVDAMSAACILERYIEDRGEGSLSATPCRFPPSDEESTFDYDIIRRHVKALHYGGGGGGSGGGGGDRERYKGKAVTKTVHGESGDSSAALCSPSDELLTQSECLAIAERDSQRRKKGTLKRRVG
jgi:RNase H-fold protein (predicted Holliday junction resolvase)